MRFASAFLSGMRSAYEVLPTETRHKAHFVKTAKAVVINLNVDTNINNSWEVIASCQKRSFNEVCHNHYETLKDYECIPTK